MIKKHYRLKEREVKKVLSRWKPFFSYDIVLNSMKNRVEYNRFAIVIGGKSVHTNVERNFFRRLFYRLMQDNIFQQSFSQNFHDCVFVVKKQTKLERKNTKSIDDFRKNISYLFRKRNKPWKNS